MDSIRPFFLCAALHLSAGTAMAARYNVQQIAFPGAAATYASVINDAGAVGGSYVDSSGGSHGFLVSNGNYTSFDGPDGPQIDTVKVKAISADGTLAGSMHNQSSGVTFAFIRTTFGSIVVPAGLNSLSFSEFNAINDKHIACGDFGTSGDSLTAFYYDTSSKVFGPSGSPSTSCTGISNAGVATGLYYYYGVNGYAPAGYTYNPATGGYNVFAYTFNYVDVVGIDSHGDTFVNCDAGALEYTAEGNVIALGQLGGTTTGSLNAVNKYGRVVGTYYNKADFFAMFTQKNADFKTFLIPDQPANVYGSNRAGALVGFAQDSANSTFSFVATPAAP